MHVTQHRYCNKYFPWRGFRVVHCPTGNDVLAANDSFMTVRHGHRRHATGIIGLLLTLALLGISLYQFRGDQLVPIPPPAARTAAGETTARVARVVDGDTIKLSGGERVRYIGIDTPELHARRGGDAEPYAAAATRANATLVRGKTVRLVFDRERRDRYGRLLAYVYVNQTFVNLTLVEQGMAVAKAFPPNTAHRAEFEAAEARARAAGLGRWEHRTR